MCTRGTRTRAAGPPARARPSPRGSTTLPACTRRLCPRPSMRSPETRTEPMGMPPSLRPCRASSSAACEVPIHMRLRLASRMCCLRPRAASGMFQRNARPGKGRRAGEAVSVATATLSVRMAILAANPDLNKQEFRTCRAFANRPLSVVRQPGRRGRQVLHRHLQELEDRPDLALRRGRPEIHRRPAGIGHDGRVRARRPAVHRAQRRPRVQVQRGHLASRSTARRRRKSTTTGTSSRRRRSERAAVRLAQGQVRPVVAGRAARSWPS